MLDSALPKTIYAIQHLAFEDLGYLEDVFYTLGFRVRYFEAGVDNLTQALEYEGLTLILGGPIGVYETADYPFLVDEIKLLKQRLLDKKPTIGICLGAQLIAHALGAKVYAGQHKEIGWSRLQLTNLPNHPLGALENTPVLHWHGDTFDLPKDAQLLASSELYPHQAFQYGHNVFGLQFHIEVAGDYLEKWLIGHTCELRHANIDIPTLRADNQKYTQALEQQGTHAMMQIMQML